LKTVNLHSLRFKLIWIHGVTIALLVACIGLIRYHVISYRSRDRFDEILLSDGQFLISRLQPEKLGIVSDADPSNPARSSATRFEPYFVITDLKGNVLRPDLNNDYIYAMLKNVDLNHILRQHNGFGNAVSADGSAYRFVSLPLPSGMLPQQAVVHVGRSMAQLGGILNEYFVFYIYSVPLILAISAAVGWYLAGRALQPFEEITRTAERITHENLNTQIVTEHTEEEIQRLVQSFNSMVQRLNASFQQMRTFNANAAHELRTPLAILQGETEVAMQSSDLPEEIRSLLESNLEELGRLTRIVNDMLTLAEAEAGRHVLAKEPVNVKILLEELVDQMALLAADQNVEIKLQEVSELWIDADALWIRRAFINILDNAIKYSKAGGAVGISATIDGLMVRIEVQDYGIGISSSDIPFIFDRLYRADPARNRESGGAGLGLALVKWIIEAHKGSIRVASQPDQGSQFEIFLPAIKQ
jgi:heavy metal sensor kinase